jgi:ankyrin repeat protein
VGVKALVDAGEKLNVMDENGDTPMHIAAGCGHKELVVELAGYD